MNNNDNILKQWWNNKKYQSKNKKKIKQSGRIWKKFLDDSILNNVMNDPYDKYHKNNIDPLTKMELDSSLKCYKYKFCWSPLNGDILGIDKRGALKFDPDILIHYF